MTHDRSAPARRSAANRATAARQVVRLGSWKVPVTVVALGLSATLHGGLLTAAYFAARSSARVSNPKISFARGDQATRIQVLLVPWPDSADEEETKQELREDLSAAESSAVTISAEKVNVEPPREDVASESRLDPPVAASDDRALLAEPVPKETNAAEVPVIEEVRTDAPMDDAVEVTLRPQPVADIFEDLLDRLERSLAPPETSEQVDRRQPLIAEAVDKAAAPPTEEVIESKASSIQMAGVETGVETLDLPTPSYPRLSRRRGEEGLVLLQVEVLPDGSVGAITVLRDAGFDRLTEAAISAARQGRFKPATRDGHAIRATVRIPFRFVLR